MTIKGFTTEAKFAFDAKATPALSAKAKLAKALIGSWYAEDQDEHADTLQILRKELIEERKRSRKVFKHK